MSLTAPFSSTKDSSEDLTKSDLKCVNDSDSDSDNSETEKTCRRLKTDLGTSTSNAFDNYSYFVNSSLAEYAEVANQDVAGRDSLVYSLTPLMYSVQPTDAPKDARSLNPTDKTTHGQAKCANCMESKISQGGSSLWNYHLCHVITQWSVLASGAWILVFHVIHIHVK